MKYTLWTLGAALALASSAQAMRENRPYDLTNLEDVIQRAHEDGLDLNYIAARDIAERQLFKPVIRDLTIVEPAALVDIVGDNFGRVIPLEDAEQIIFHTWLSGIANPLDIMQRAHELKIGISFESAQKLALKEAFIDKFFSQMLPDQIKARFYELFGKRSSDEQAQEIAADLFERRISD